jgi:hypothetical protein
VSIYTSPEDKEVADGHGSTLFKKESRDKIIIESSGEPGFELFRKEMELNENNVPLKITDAGVYAYTGANGELSKISDGHFYAVFTYEPSTHNLIRQVIYDIETDEKIISYDYEYDSNTGAFSRIDLPLWYYTYQAYGNRDYRSAYNRLFFNYSNNLVKETVYDEGAAQEKIFRYTYKYNEGNAPVFMEHDTEDVPNISITY